MATFTPAGGLVRRFGGAASVLVSITSARAGEQFRWVLGTPQALGSDLAHHTPAIIARTSKRSLRDLGRLSTLIGQGLSNAAHDAAHRAES